MLLTFSYILIVSFWLVKKENMFFRGWWMSQLNITQLLGSRFQQIFGGDIQNPQKGTFTNPCQITHQDRDTQTSSNIQNYLHRETRTWHPLLAVGKPSTVHSWYHVHFLWVLWFCQPFEILDKPLCVCVLHIIYIYIYIYLCKHMYIHLCKHMHIIKQCKTI